MGYGCCGHGWDILTKNQSPAIVHNDDAPLLECKAGPVILYTHDVTPF
jgi:hypothetical protein